MANSDAPNALAALHTAALEVAGAEPRDVKLRRTGRGLVAMITIAIKADLPLTEAHSLASQLETRAQELDPSLDEVVVHTEPA